MSPVSTRPRTTLAGLLLLALAPHMLGAGKPEVATLDVALTVSDLERSIAFFHEVLDFELVSRAEQAGPEHEQLEGVFASRSLSARMRLGAEELELVEWLAPESRPYPADSRSNDRWFQHVAIVVADMDAAYARLREHHVRHASSGPQRLPDWNPDAGGIEAFYFKDPDGHVLELIAFPTGKGAPRWQEPHGSALFLGIDHTAIGVASTERSLAFWSDLLGLAVAGRSENYGGEQEHLNAVFGAHLAITGLRGASGVGVELLDYLSPGDGRPYPADARASDLVHWETRVSVPDLAGLIPRLRAARVAFVSSDPVALDGELRLLVRDPDGHAVELVQRAPRGAMN